MIAIRHDGRIVSRSRNLRGVLRYGRGKRALGPLQIRGVPGVQSVHVLELPDGGALLRLRWTNRAYAVARFASCTVARNFARARRYWPAHRFTPLQDWHAPTRKARA